MKQIAYVTLLVLLTCNFTSTLAQSGGSINSSNYSEYHRESGTTAWLNAYEAVPVIIDELIKKGIKPWEIDASTLVKINDTVFVSVSVSFYVGSKYYGIIYETGHNLFLNKNDRDFLKEVGPSYSQAARDVNQDLKYYDIPHLPSFLYLLKENCYWYQYDEHSKGTYYPVTKTVITQILRSDIDIIVDKIILNTSTN